MNDYAAHSRAVATLQARLGADCPSITWKRKNVPVIPGSAARRGELSSGGIQLNADFQFEALVSAFEGYEDVAALHADLLSAHSLTYLGESYRPAAVLVRPGGLQIQVQCAAVNQG